MTGCTTWGTEPRRRPAGRRAAILLAAAAVAAAAGIDAPAAATAADLRATLERAAKAMRRARDAADGRDPGRVSLLLVRADEEVAQLEKESGVAPLGATLESAREEAARGNLAGAAAAIERARSFLPPLSDYVMNRQAEVAARAALAAAGAGDGAAFLGAHARLEAAVLAPALRARLDEARRALAWARAAMVRRDLKGGAPEIDAALRALDGVRYAGALSRAAFALRVGSELLQEKAVLAARDQTRRGLKEIRQAAAWVDGDERAALESIREEATEVWRRMGRARDGDSEILAGAAGRLETLRAALAPR